jgi:hypothetical protein
LGYFQRRRHQPRRPTLAKINLMGATRYAVTMLRNVKTLDHYNYLDHYDYLDLDIVYIRTWALLNACVMKAASTTRRPWLNALPSSPASKLACAIRL